VGVLGGQILDVNATINDFHSGYQQTFGKFSFTPSHDDIFHSDLILIWHSNPAHTWMTMFHYMAEARYRGAEVVLISTDVSPSHSHVDYHIPVRHGTDTALALAACQAILSEGLVDWGFAASQTDLSLLVRTDTGEFLRESHLEGDGRDDRFFQGHPERGVVPADPASLRLGFEPLAESTLEVETRDAGRIRVEPLFARLRRMLDEHYTPEQAAEICEVHPDTIRMLARKVAARTTRTIPEAGVCKHYHGDLMCRAKALLFGLTGNWGKKGAGLGSWCSFMFDGNSTVMAKTEPGVEAGRALLEQGNALRRLLRQQDPTLTGELPDRVILRAMGGGMMMPPAFFWYTHAGYRERWNNPDWHDPSMKRPFDEYYREASGMEAWGEAPEIAATRPPRVLLEVGGNTLRRTRGGKKLPATQHYEKTAFGMPTTWPFILSMSHAVVPPYGESRGEWEALGALVEKIAERASERGLEGFQHRSGEWRRYDELWDLFTLKGTLIDDESVVREALADAVTSGNMPPGITIETFRKQGYSRYNDWAFLALGTANASPFPRNETHAPLRNHVELGHPYPTLTRRAQFLIDHPWYREAGEDLPVHKEPPAMGGDGPFRLSGGHARWSEHDQPADAGDTPRQALRLDQRSGGT
jgi:anaerobic selenocysteine-containing dehydrogenase